MTDVQVVNPQPYIAGVASFARSAVVVASSAVALAGFVSKHDWAGLASYVQSQPFTLAGATVMSFGFAGYGAWRAYVRNHQLGKAADDPANTAIVRGK